MRIEDDILLEKSGQEIIRDHSREFPYQKSKALIYAMPDRLVPWHWHQAIEIAYVESGCLDYSVPGKTVSLSAGSATILNTSVLHSTRQTFSDQPTTVLVHLFDPSFIAGQPGGIIERKYILPILTSRAFDLLVLNHDDPESAGLLEAIRSSFTLDEMSEGFEIRIRSALSLLWMDLISMLPEDQGSSRSILQDRPLKEMLLYIQNHAGESIPVSLLARVGSISERECYRQFQNVLGTTPAQYIRQHRLSQSAHLLRNTDQTLTQIALACGFGSSSQFCRVFQNAFQTSPGQYRKKWQKSSINGHGSTSDSSKNPVQ